MTLYVYMVVTYMDVKGYVLYECLWNNSTGNTLNLTSIIS